MTVLVVDFLEAVQIENDEAERLTIAAGTIEFFFESFAKEAAIVEPGEGIGDGIQLQLLQFVVLYEDGNAEKAGRRKHVHKSCFQRDLPLHVLTKFAAACEHFIPELHTLSFTKIKVGDGAEVALEE